MPEFAAYLFAPSAVRFPAEGAIEVKGAPESELPIRHVRITTQYLPPPCEPLARGLEIEVRGEIETLEKAVDRFLGVGADFLPTLTLAGNAFVDDPHLIASYDVTSGVSDHDWLQQLPAHEPVVPPNSREMQATEAGALLAALEAHPQRDRVDRAIAQYREALRHWRPGDELMAVEHLQIAAETITPVIVDRVVAASGLSIEQLAQRWGFDELTGDLGRFVNSRVRLDEIYDGNNDLRRAVERASNGFEHGDETFERAMQLARASRDGAAQLIRLALLREIELDQSEFKALADERYLVPLPLFVSEHFWRGTLRVEDDRALDPEAQPLLLREARIHLRSATRTATGRISVKTGYDLGGPPQGAAITLQSKLTRMPVGLPQGAELPAVSISDVAVEANEGPLADNER